jgi:F0F1-type ATP synthase assembly protein I
MMPPRAQEALKWAAAWIVGFMMGFIAGKAGFLALIVIILVIIGLCAAAYWAIKRIKQEIDKTLQKGGLE